MEPTVSGSKGIAAMVGSVISILMIVNVAHPLPFIDTLIANKDSVVSDLTAIVGAVVVLYTAASSPPTWLRSLFWWKKPLAPGAGVQPPTQ